MTNYTDTQADHPKSEQNPSRKPLFVRLFHWSIALCFAIAYATSYRVFDYSSGMPIVARDALFAIHRLSGIIAGILLLLWFLIRLKNILLSIRIPGSFRVLGVYHVILGLACFILPVLPWIARAQKGRIDELYSLLPVFNLASHPNTVFVYKLLYKHKQLADIVMILLLIHIAGALFHRYILKDKVLWAMSFGKK